MRELQRRLNRSGRAARLQLGATVAIGAVGTVLIVAQATVLAQVISRAFMEGAVPSELVGALLALVAIALGRGLVGFGFEWTGRLGAARVMSELRGRLVERILFDRPGDPDRRAGAIAAAGVQGVEALEAYYARYMPQVALAALAPPVILLWVLPRDWHAAAILALTFPMIPVFMVLVGKLAERSVRKRWSSLTGLSNRFLDLVSGLATLRAYGRAEAQVETIAAASDEYRVQTMATLRVAFLSALVLELVAMLGTALVAAAIGVQLASGTLQLEQGLTVLLLAPELYAPLRQVGAQFHASTDGLAAAESIFEVIDSEPLVRGPSAVAPATGRVPDPACEPLLLRGIGFSYPDAEQPVLENLCLRIEPGESVALTGPSGAGKTTLASLLLRLADPTAGELRCGSADLGEIDLHAWREQVAWIPQRPTIFAASVRENVALHDPAADEDEVRAALAEAGALRLVEALPDGLATVVGEGGRRLSAGEAQRVALARAFLRDPSLVVLDEPTAHLDDETASAFDAAITRLLVGRTALIITHRSALAALADGVVELRHGAACRVPGGSSPTSAPPQPRELEGTLT